MNTEDPETSKQKKQHNNFAVVYDESAMIRILSEMAYPIPETAERVPWLERLDIVVPQFIEAKQDQDVSREKQFEAVGLEGVCEAMKKFKYLGVKHIRPKDFYADMIKSDGFVRKIQHKLNVTMEKLSVVMNRKDAQEARKFKSKRKRKSK